eukprot:364773-Chlamydomonas_euryale.AAC.1
MRTRTDAARFGLPPPPPQQQQQQPWQPRLAACVARQWWPAKSEERGTDTVDDGAANGTGVDRTGRPPTFRAACTADRWTASAAGGPTALRRCVGRVVRCQRVSPLGTAAPCMHTCMRRCQVTESVGGTKRKPAPGRHRLARPAVRAAAVEDCPAAIDAASARRKARR